ncbi:MAG: nodulation protein NfeD [bacterium]|nr:nodulation protein NfeD [bacterium]
MKLLFTSLVLLNAEIYKASIEAPITPSISEYICSVIDIANKEGGKLIVIKMDTPGGLDEAMRSINKAILASKIPVVAYISPEGSRAASAGAFIAMASHIIAMAPGTSIGACHPVALGTQMDSVMVKKVTNDAVAYLKSLAELRGRNSKWAELAVYEAKSSSAIEALKEGVIEYVVSSLEELLDSLNGKRIKMDGGEFSITLQRPYKVKEIKMSLREKLLTILSNPNIAYILLLLGFYGLFFELSNPGAIFPGVFGSICLILAFYSLQTLPVNYAGLALIVLSIILFVLEAFIQSHGILAVGGIVSFVLGSLMLFKGGPMFQVSKSLIVSISVISAVFFIWLISKGVKTFFLKPTTGKEGLVGEKGVAETPIDSKGGMCLIHGELWKAKSGEKIEKGEEVEVVKVEGLTLYVKKCEK